MPILGICLGHQAIVEAFGKDENMEFVGRSKVGPMHGNESKVFHDQETILKDVPNPLQVIRYHSLSAKSGILPQDPKVSAIMDDGTIIGARHKQYLVEGIQFHPNHHIPFLYNFFITLVELCSQLKAIVSYL